MWVSLVSGNLETPAGLSFENLGDFFFLLNTWCHKHVFSIFYCHATSEVDKCPKRPTGCLHLSSPQCYYSGPNQPKSHAEFFVAQERPSSGSCPWILRLSLSPNWEASPGKDSSQQTSVNSLFPGGCLVVSPMASVPAGSFLSPKHWAILLLF